MSYLYLSLLFVRLFVLLLARLTLSNSVARLLLGWGMVLRGDEVVGRLLRRSYHVDPAVVQQKLLAGSLPATPEAAQSEFASAVLAGDLFLMHLIWFCTFPVWSRVWRSPYCCSL